MTMAAGPGVAACGSGERGGSDDEMDLDMSTEQLYESREIPTWKQQLTVRAFVIALVLGFFHNFIVMRMSLTTGMIPSLNISAGLLGFFFLKSWTKVVEKMGFQQQPFTRQENTVVQTCVVACQTLAFSGGFGSNILGMSTLIGKGFAESNDAKNMKEPQIGWLMALLFIISFVGLFCVAPLRKIMILRYKLIYPTGSATAHLINSFHTPEGALMARKQVSLLFKSVGCSFIWSFFKWFYEGGARCGFQAFPTLGLEAYRRSFYFDFSSTYVGVGMMCPYMVNISLMLGAIVSHGIMWPYIRSKEGLWYKKGYNDRDLHGIAGYQVFIGTSLILGDGLFHFFTVMSQSLYDMHVKRKQQGLRTSSSTRVAVEPPTVSFDDRRRIKVFLKDAIPTRVLAAGYLALSAVSVTTIPLIFPQLRPYHVAFAYLIAPILAFCNAYSCGLTDWSLANQYGKLAIFLFGAWVGGDRGGVLAGLAACSIVVSVVSTASDIMQDFKTGYLTLSSPRSMFISQMIGTAMGCIISPFVFLMFYTAFLKDGIDPEFQSPYAQIYRGIALIGAKGFSSLPKNCPEFCLWFFLMGIGINMVKEVARYMGWGVAGYVPSPMAMAVPFYSGAYFTVDMCVGGLIMWVWSRSDKKRARVFGLAVASGMICGDGLFTLPASMLALMKVNAPICMRFLSRAENVKVNEMLGGRR